MKSFLTIVLVLIFIPAFSQNDPETLAKKLIASAKNDHEKVEQIFHWITDNISYTVFPRQPFPFVIQSEPEDDGPLKPLNERVAGEIIKRRTALCDGYARLFKTLCDYAGIRAEIIQGYAQSVWNKTTPRFGVNHYWNAVFLDGKWKLLDATWASGYVNWKGDQFIKDYEPGYFLTTPEQFIRDHYPDNPRWTLLPDSKVPDEFRYSPFKQKAFTKYKIISFFPSSGIINASIGDTLQFRLETADLSNREISPDLSADSTLFDYSASWVFLKPQAASSKSTVHRYSYIIKSTDVQWIYLLFNEDIVLKYKLNLKPISK